MSAVGEKGNDGASWKMHASIHIKMRRAPPGGGLLSECNLLYSL